MTDTQNGQDICDTFELVPISDHLFIEHTRLQHRPIFDRPIPCMPHYMFDNVQHIIWDSVNIETAARPVDCRDAAQHNHFRPKTNPLIVFFPDFAPHSCNAIFRNYLSEYDTLECEDRQVRIPIGWHQEAHSDGILYRLHMNTNVIHVLNKKGYWRHYIQSGGEYKLLPSAVLKNILAHQQRFKATYLK